MLKSGKAGALKIQLDSDQLEALTKQARVLSAGRDKGMPIISPNQVLLSYALRGLEMWGAEEAAAAQLIADERAGGVAAEASTSAEAKAAIKAQKAALKAAAKAEAALEKAKEAQAKADAAQQAVVLTKIQPTETQTTTSGDGVGQDEQTVVLAELESELVG